MAEHRVLMLRDSLLGRRLPDRSSDPRIRTIEDGLAQLRVAPDPDPLFRADLRAQLVAVAPRLVAEGHPAEVESTGKHRAGTTRSTPATAPARHSDARGRRFPVARSLRIVTAMFVVAALLLGGAYWQSRDALPGDNLYGIKRASERVELSLASSDSDRAQDELKFSQRRVNEVLSLWKQNTPSAMGRMPLADPAVSDAVAKLIADTLDDANADLFAGASGLNAAAVRTRSESLLQILRSWARGQSDLLGGIATAMKPSRTPLVRNVNLSADLVRQATDRAEYWSSDLGRACQPTSRDRFGPVPCATTRANRPSGQPSGGPTGTIRTGGSGGNGGSSGGGGKSTSPRNEPTTARPSGSASRTGGAAPSTSKAPGGILPTTPARVSVGSQCVSVSAGPIDIGVGCPSG